MKKIQFELSYESAESEAELNQEDANLLSMAKNAAKDAYAPYSNFKVGAAVLLNDGKIIIGSNQENAAYPVTICGERNAIFAASAQYPNTPIKALAITVISAKGNINNVIPPCGSCRQVIFETETRHNQDIRVILQGDSGQVIVMPSIKNIFPLTFDSSYLK